MGLLVSGCSTDDSNEENVFVYGIAFFQCNGCAIVKKRPLAFQHPENGHAVAVDVVVHVFEQQDGCLLVRIDGQRVSLFHQCQEGFFGVRTSWRFVQGNAHGFEANDYCLAVNFDIGPQQDLGASNIMPMFDAFEKQHRTKMDLAVISGPTPTF